MNTSNRNVPPPPFGAAGSAAHWMLDPRITFLNHGSFGATPRVVFDAQTEWRRRVEAEPIELLARRGDALLDEAKRPVGALLGMQPPDFGFVTNATEGVNAVLRSMQLNSGDELLTTTHVYNAVRKAMQFVARQRGATYREIDVPLPVNDSGEIAQRVIDGLGPRTRLLIIDHVTSPTALIFPVEQICAECNARGIEVLVDGAHGPGMLDLNVAATGATYYAGNLHKWCCCPKGGGFLWVRPDRQRDVHPLIISHFLDESFVKEFGWQGTRDVSAWLTIPAALEFMRKLGWPHVRQHNHAMAVWAHAMLAEQLDLPPLSPLDGRLLGTMASLPLPGALHEMTEAQSVVLQRRLYDEFRLEMPLMLWNAKYYLRVCAQVYNTADQYERVVDVIRRLSQSFR